MINYILNFVANGHKLTVHKNDDGCYVVTRNSREVATCSEFPDALAVFRNHRDYLESRVLDWELGK